MNDVTRILMVEDLPTDADLAEREVRQALPRSEFRRVETREGFLAELEAFQPDLILCDYKLPCFDGLTALKLAQERAPEVPFLLVTGSMNEDTAVQCMKAGAWDYIIKEHLKRLGPAVLNSLEQGRRRRDQERARARALRWEQMFAEAQFGLALGSIEDNTFLAVNPTFARERGYTPDELVGRSILEIYAPEEREALKQKFGAIDAAGHAVFESVHLRKDGSRFPVLMEVTTVTDDGGQPASRVAYALDITERKRADTALAEREAEFRRLSQEFRGLLDAVPDSLSLQDRELKILWTNQTSAGGPGGAKENVGRHCYRVWHNRDEPCDPCPVKESFATGRFVAGTVTRPNGAVVDLRVVPLSDEQGETSRVIAVRRDVTSLLALEQQLHQAQKMEAVGRLAGGVAHDFNNLLTIINGLAELAASELSPDAPVLPRLQGIQDAGTRAANLTRQLLAFARQQVVCPRALDLNEAIGGMAKMLRRLIGEDIDLVWKPGGDVCRVYLDPSHVDQLLANLVVNARDAIPGTGTVTLETTNAVLDEAFCATHAGATHGEHAVLTVTDTGCGMDRETLARIFEPFFTTKELGKGTGLGLATVYGIVKQAGGSIYAESAPGQGTTFRLYLPRWEGGQTEAARPEDAPKSLRGTETVLLVEDEAPILDLGRSILEKHGYRVLTASSPGEALLAAEREPGTIHLLAADVVLPGMNGREVWERLRILRPELKCLYLSGYAADAITRRGVLPEGVNFLQKPYSMKGLAAKVRSVLDG